MRNTKHFVTGGLSYLRIVNCRYGKKSQTLFRWRESQNSTNIAIFIRTKKRNSVYNQESARKSATTTVGKTQSVYNQESVRKSIKVYTSTIKNLQGKGPECVHPQSRICKENSQSLYNQESAILVKKRYKLRWRALEVAGNVKNILLRAKVQLEVRLWQYTYPHKPPTDLLQTSRGHSPDTSSRPHADLCAQTKKKKSTLYQFWNRTKQIINRNVTLTDKCRSLYRHSFITQLIEKYSNTDTVFHTRYDVVQLQCTVHCVPSAYPAAHYLHQLISSSRLWYHYKIACMIKIARFLHAFPWEFRCSCSVLRNVCLQQIYLLFSIVNRPLRLDCGIITTLLV